METVQERTKQLVETAKFIGGASLEGNDKNWAALLLAIEGASENEDEKAILTPSDALTVMGITC